MRILSWNISTQLTLVSSQTDEKNSTSDWWSKNAFKSKTTVLLNSQFNIFVFLYCKTLKPHRIWLSTKWLVFCTHKKMKWNEKWKSDLFDQKNPTKLRTHWIRINNQELEVKKRRRKNPQEMDKHYAK